MGLVATGVCSMVGAGINVIPFMIQRHVPGIGPHVLLAFAVATVPAALAGLAYAILASAVPRAGGSYVSASRGLSPYLGFIASFSQWFSLCVATGVVSYVLVPFLRDIAVAAGAAGLAGWLETGPVRLTISLACLWTAAAVNLRGVKAYERLIVPLMFLTFALGAVVIVAGLRFDHADFGTAMAGRGLEVPATARPPLTVGILAPASALLFASFIGFDSIAQAGGEARRPGRDLPLAIGIAIGSVGLFYLLFTAALYHAVPWSVHRRRIAAARPDGTGPARRAPAPGVDRDHRLERGRGLDQGSTGDAAGGVTADVRVGAGRHLPVGCRGGAPEVSDAARRHRGQRRHGHDRRGWQPPGR